MTRVLFPLITVLLLGFAPAADAAGEVNKCVGPDGKVTYSHQPCPDDATSERVKIRRDRSSDATGSSNNASSGNGEPGSMKKLNERIANAEDPVMKAQLEITKEQCELAKTQMERYDQAPYLVRENDQGEKVRLSDEEAAAEKARVRKFLETECQ